MKTEITAGRYTVQVTVNLYAQDRQDAYRQIRRALSNKRDGVEFVDAEDTKIEPFCANLLASDEHGEWGDERDLAVEGTTLCATCLANKKCELCDEPAGAGGALCPACETSR